MNSTHGMIAAPFLVVHPEVGIADCLLCI